MNQFKRAKVVILPTNEKVINKIGDICMFSYGLNIAGNADLGYPVQHLHITSDDKIKKGDRYIFTKNNQICRADYDDENLNTLNRLNDYCKKIIATTDSSLKVWHSTCFSGEEIYVSLPQPSQQFIKKYIEEYNKGNIIVDVLVEYETNNIHNQDLMFHQERKAYFFEDIVYGKMTTIYLEENLKINSKDNTITIKRVKESWDRKELIQILRHFDMTKGRDIPSKEFDKWIEENLN